MNHEFSFEDNGIAEHYWVFQCHKTEKAAEFRDKPNLNYCLYCGNKVESSK